VAVLGVGGMLLVLLSGPCLHRGPGLNLLCNLHPLAVLLQQWPVPATDRGCGHYIE
jgi:hypothetical protein